MGETLCAPKRLRPCPPGTCRCQECGRRVKENPGGTAGPYFCDESCAKHWAHRTV